MYDVYLLAFHTPRRILYDRIKKHFLESDFCDAKIIEIGDKIEIKSGDCQMILDKKENLNENIYVCLRTGKLVGIKLTKKTIGDLLKEIEKYFKKTI